ncbi:hypothetical protein ACG7TL_001610 [Trametes sanguinea]
MAKKPTKDDCWSLSMRGHCFGDGYSSDEDSDQDSPLKATDGDSGDTGTIRLCVPASEDSRLLGELDLASRTDTANYKPNPWSIARANAANRLSKAPPPAQNKPACTRPAQAAETVLDMLRNQPKKTRTNNFKPAEAPACSTASALDPQPLNYLDGVRSPTDVELWLEDGAHIPSDETLVDHNSYQPDVLNKDTTVTDSASNADLAPTKRLEPDDSVYNAEPLALGAEPPVPTSPTQAPKIPSGFEFRPKLSESSRLSSQSTLTIPPPQKWRVPTRQQRSPPPPSSPSPPPRPQKSLYASNAEKKRDAYEAFGSPDAQWNTLATAKKGRTANDKKAGTKGRNAFKLPLRIGAALQSRKAESSHLSVDSQKKGETAAQRQRRVVTYLPPPPNSAPASASRTDDRCPGDQAAHSPKDGRYARSERDSVMSSSSSSPFKPLAVRRVAPPTMSLPNYKYTGPSAESSSRPRTARPTGSNSPGVTVNFDDSGLPERYDVVRRRVAQ